MQKVASFGIDHDALPPGLYLSRVDFGDLYTYDLRFRRPNSDDFLTPAQAHTIEHLFANFIRSGEIGDRVAYFGPMGCLTGFELLLKGTPPARAVAEIQKGMAFVRDFTGRIPGARRRECGNYRMHNLAGARRAAAAYCEVIADWDERRLGYPGQ
jgi:S-ribosylhomocysteine lyase